MTTSTLFRPLVFGVPLFTANNATSFLGLAGFVVLFASSRRLLHAILMPLFLAFLLVDILWWSGVIVT